MKKQGKYSLIPRIEAHEWIIWSVSMATVLLSYFAAPQGVLSLVSSLIGVCAVFFVSKGHVAGQILTVVFSVLYGIISFNNAYYGEMITYIGMSAPMAIVATVQWLRNPYKNSNTVTIAKLTTKKFVLLSIFCVATTAAFYFILGALGNASLFVSTVSVATSFMAASLVALRSPWYAVFYALNDVVLIILWFIASAKDISNLPMTACFATFLINDTYAFINWRRMAKNQTQN